MTSMRSEHPLFASHIFLTISCAVSMRLSYGTTSNVISVGPLTSFLTSTLSTLSPPLPPAITRAFSRPRPSPRSPAWRRFHGSGANELSGIVRARKPREHTKLEVCDLRLLNLAGKLRPLFFCHVFHHLLYLFVIIYTIIISHKYIYGNIFLAFLYFCDIIYAKGVFI